MYLNLDLIFNKTMFKLRHDEISLMGLNILISNKMVHDNKSYNLNYFFY